MDKLLSMRSSIGGITLHDKPAIVLDVGSEYTK